MDYRNLKRNIEKNNVNSVYLFTGEEEYMMDKFIEIIKNKYVDKSLESLNYILIEKSHTFDDLFNACETLAFMSERKIVLVKDLNEFIKQDSKNRDRLNDYVVDLGEDTILILKDKTSSLRKNTKLYKTLNRLDAIVDFKRLNNQDLASWARMLVESKGKMIDNNSLTYFLQKSGYLEYRSEKTLFELENELLKIIDHTSDDIISRVDIDSNLVEDLDTNIFNLLDYINSGNTSAALGLVDEMDRANEPMPRVFFMIIRQFRLLIQYKTFKARGYNNSEIRNKLKIRPYEFNKISKNSKRHKMKDLKEDLEYMLEMDRKQKTSSQDEKLAMELLIIKITR